MAESKSDRFDMVVENENRRVGRMSKEELSQCVLDIKGFFERVGVKVTGASSGSFQSLGKAFDFDIPEAFSYFLESVNGNIWFMEKEASEWRQIYKVRGDRLQQPVTACVLISSIYAL